jgi:hypothetical protein
MAQGQPFFEDEIAPRTYEGQNVGSKFIVELWYGPQGTESGNLIVLPGSQATYVGNLGDLTAGSTTWDW